MSNIQTRLLVKDALIPIFKMMMCKDPSLVVLPFDLKDTTQTVQADNIKQLPTSTLKTFLSGYQTNKAGTTRFVT